MATNPLIDRIMDQLRLKLPGALDGVTQIELWNTCDDFLSRTNVWLDDTEIKLKPGDVLYDFTPSISSAAVRRIMIIKNPDGTNFPIKAWMPVPGTLQLASPVSDEQKVTVTLALSVGDPGKRQVYPDMPDWIWSEYYNELIDGTIGRMYGQPAKPYSNPQMAAYHLKAFNAGCNQAKWMANRGRRFEGQRWRFPQSYSGPLLRRP